MAVMAGNAAQTSSEMPVKINFLRPVPSMARATRASSKAFTDERSIISMPGSASTGSGNVGPHMLSRAVVITTIGSGLTLLEVLRYVSAARAERKGNWCACDFGPLSDFLVESCSRWFSGRPFPMNINWSATSAYDLGKRMILKIRQVGELVLRQKSRPLSVEEIGSQYVRHLVESMRETMHDAPGVGLAAPQIGIPLQLVVIEDTPEAIQRLSPEQATERERRPVPFQVLINPILTMPEGGAEFFEGCLSLAGYTAIVPRAKRVHVEALNEHAEPVVIDATGWYARILQHEIDHLHGVLYIDRMNPRSFTTQDNYYRIWKDKSIPEVAQVISGELA
jgi:peptide deformylase